MEEYLKAGISVYAPRSLMTSRLSTYRNFYPISPTEIREVGRFKITAFDCVHDVECLGYLIKHDDIGKLLFATDTEYVKYRFKDLHHIMIEANYDRDLIGDASNRNHILKGHMEIHTTCEFLKVNNNPRLTNVILMHLSNTNSDERRFKEKSELAIGCRVHVANRGMSIHLSKTGI